MDRKVNLMAIIKVENLSKRYIIGHDRNAGGAFKYKSLRDSLTHLSRSAFQRLLHPLSPNRENTDLEEFWALRDVSFEINQGDRVGIIGRNGAGKSTLLKILSRITEPTTGKIQIKGRVASLLEVGTGFHPELSGRENIYLNGAVLGMTRAEIKRKFDEIVAFSEVEKFLDTPVKHYSSGMYVRLAFSVAAHLEPEILVVDEVLAVGDAQFQKKCLGKMEDVAKEGRTVLFVSHNMVAVQQLCSKCILLSEGKIQIFSDTKNVISKYLSLTNSEVKGKRWEDLKSAPGDENIKLIEANVVYDNNPTEVVPIDKDFYIEFDFYNFKKDFDNLSYSIHVLDRSGCMVFGTTSISSANSIEKPSKYLNKPLPIGKYKISIKIPGNFLNDQTYRVNIAIISNTTIVHVLEKEILSFTVHETGSMREENVGAWGGVVRPRFETQIIPLEMKETIK